MLRLKNLANKYQKRTCRPVYANTQATPFAATLDATAFRSSTGTLQIGSGSAGASTAGSGGTYGNPAGVTRTTSSPYTLGTTGSLCPGLVVVKSANSEGVSIANGKAGGSERPFGLLANFVGGELDEGFSGDSLQNEVGVWRGPDSVFEILAPAYDATNMPTSSSGVAGTPLYAQRDGRLGIAQPVTGNAATTGFGPESTNTQVVAYLVKAEANRIIVDLAV